MPLLAQVDMVLREMVGEVAAAVVLAVAVAVGTFAKHIFSLTMVLL